MQFVPGSHREGPLLHNKHPNGHTLHVIPPAASTIVSCPVPMGGVTLHTPLTLHHTGPNRSEFTRRAWILHFGPWGRMAKLHPSVVAERLSRKLLPR
jgi:ectoine hydroxylase-related dioxygenase (phytanoyl-CoA dioxygenase family)